MRKLLEHRRTGERIEITGARHVDGELEVVLGDEDDHGSPEYIRGAYKPAEPRRLTLRLIETIEVELDERELFAYFGESPSDRRLRDWAANEPFCEGVDHVRRRLEAWAVAGSFFEPSYSTEADTASRCLQHGAWRFPDDGSNLSIAGSCFACDHPTTEEDPAP